MRSLVCRHVYPLAVANVRPDSFVEMKLHQSHGGNKRSVGSFCPSMFISFDEGLLLKPTLTIDHKFGKSYARRLGLAIL